MRNIYRLPFFLASFVTAVLCASRAVAHGIPIQLEVVGNVLSVGGGIDDSAGFAPMIFVQDDEEGDPFGEASIPGLGPSIIWQVPGFEISGMDEHSGLYIEVLSRPYFFSNPSENRVHWYWNPESQRVGNSPADNSLGIINVSGASITLSPGDEVAPPPLKVAEPLASDEGFHNHLLAYALSESIPPPAGAYGFFARLKSDQYAPSEPFLVVLNDSVFDYGQMIPAALAINAAAFLPGDYNHDDRVDAADYIVWRKTLGSTTTLAADASGNQEVDEADYTIWRSNFGDAYPTNGQLNGLAVPEASSWALLVVGLVCVVILYVGGRSSLECRWRSAGAMIRSWRMNRRDYPWRARFCGEWGGNFLDMEKRRRSMAGETRSRLDTSTVEGYP
ncbi:MAG TPA: hypothetical protein VHE81_19600 [Lacipirellulaceae bacterium]|nr:hypothetical protein [Lacipirellulaceae bacterium]